MSPRIFNDTIGGVRVVRRVMGSVFEELGSVPHKDPGPSKRPHAPQRPVDLVRPFDGRPGGIAIQGPDGSYLLGNRGVPQILPVVTTLAASLQEYPLLQVHWSDDVARPALLSLSQRFPAFAEGADPTRWGALRAHLSWSQGSSSILEADVDIGIGTAFPITFSSLSVLVRKDYVTNPPNSDQRVVAQAGIAPVGYGGFGRPTRTTMVVLTGSGVLWTGQLSRPLFANRVNLSWDQSQTSGLKVTYKKIFDYGTETDCWIPAASGPVPPIILPNDCYGIYFNCEASVTVNAVWELDIR